MTEIEDSTLARTPMKDPGETTRQSSSLNVGAAENLKNIFDELTLQVSVL